MVQDCLSEAMAGRRASNEISPQSATSILGRRARGEDEVVDDDESI
jgi:hypothetical protein